MRLLPIIVFLILAFVCSTYGIEVNADTDEIKKELKEHLDEILEKLKDGIDHGKTINEDLTEKLKELIAKLKEMKVDIPKEAQNKIAELLGPTKTRIQNFLNELMNSELQNPCDVIGQSPKNLTNQVILVVDWNHKNESVPEDHGRFNGEPTIAYRYMYSFFECYGTPSGLSFTRLMIDDTNNEKKMNVKCTISDFNVQNIPIGPNYQYKVIITYYVDLYCSMESIQQEIFKLTNTTNIQFIPLLICSRCDVGLWQYKYKNDRPNGALIHYSTSPLLYEHLTSILEDSVFGSDNDLTPQYYYLNSIEKSNKNRSIWPPLAAIGAVLLFIIIGCISCVSTATLYTFVEEDFRARNDEREWLERQAPVRRQVEYGVDVANEQAAGNVDGNVRDNGGMEVDLTQLSSEMETIPYESIMTEDGTQSSETFLGTNDTQSTTTIIDANICEEETQETT